MRLFAMALAAACLAAAASAAERPPAEQYLLHCSGCHGRDGGGAPPTTPSLHDLAAVLAAPGGRAYLARVPGVAQAPISDAELAQLLEWVLREFSQATVDPPFSPEEIGRLRSAPLRDPVAARPAPARAGP